MIISKPSLSPGIVHERRSGGNSATDPAPHDLKRKTAHGALAAMFTQGANFVFRIGSMMVLARLLVPADFGLVGMATACTGFLGLVQGLGLSTATVQVASITREQTSTLFWINLAVGGFLAALCVAMAPLIAVFYHEPRLFWVTVALGSGYVFNGAAAQHMAMFYRAMRFPTLAIIEISSICVSIAIGVGMALAGFGYWALVGMTLSPSVVTLLCLWTLGGWMPGAPRRGAGVRSMLKYGSTATLINIITYVACNADKVLLGRFWGAEVLGIYGRAYQLINVPSENLRSAIGRIALPALSRLQNDSERLRSYFLQGYGLFLSVVMPITMACALLADDIVLVFLGPKWSAATPVFRLLAPSTLAFAMINPFTWLLEAIGLAARGLWTWLLIAPVMIIGYLAGLGHGSAGVAAALSATIALLVVPTIFWSTRGTPVTAVDVIRVVLPPLLSILIAAGSTLALWPFIHLLASPILRLAAASAALFSVYGIIFWFGAGGKSVYIRLLRAMGVWPLTGRKMDESVKNAEA